MKKTKSFLGRLLAILLVFMTLISVLTVNAAAADSSFMETLIDTDSYVYVANLVSDTKARGKKYAYKYMNLAQLMRDDCGLGDLNDSRAQYNPNYCFRLNSTTGSFDYRRSKNLDAFANKGNRLLDLFLIVEGYVDQNGTLISDDSKIASASTGRETEIMKTRKTKQTSPLSYPGYYNHAVTTEQSEYAQESLITLVASLNGILTTVNDGKRFTSVTELVNKSIMIRPNDDKNVVILEKNEGGKYQGYVLIYADLTHNTRYPTSPIVTKESSAGEANRKLSTYKDKYVYNSQTEGSADFLDYYGLPRASINNALYCYVFPIEGYANGQSHRYELDPKKGVIFEYAIPKGFMSITAQNASEFSPILFTDKGGEPFEYTENQSDVPWISINMLSFYANLVYKQENLSVSTYVEPEPNIFSKMLAGIFNGILSVIRSVLGLTDIDTLVFNLGSRGSSSYNYGLMSENWWNVVLQYQLIFQAIAWVILVCGFLKTLIDLNLSTINPQKRSTIYDTVQKFIVVGIGLVILIPCVQFLLECNDTLVELFASQIETSTLNMPVVNNVLVQFIVGMSWLTIILYINFIYIMRSITVALLIASGPFFISTVAFSKRGSSELFVSWSKELLANIFVQSVHAFVLSFLMQLLSSGTFLETFAIAISIIPITEMFRGLIFAGAGGSTSQLANTAASAANKGLNGITKGAVSGVAGIMGRDGDGGGNGSGGDGGGGSKPDPRAVFDQRKAAKLEKMAQGTSAGGRIKDASERRSGKEGGSIFGKIAGGAVDVVGLAGLEVMSKMDTLADLQQGLADIQLKGDATAFGKAAEKSVSGDVSTGAAIAGGAASALQHRANRKKNSNVRGEAMMSNTSQMGSAAITEESRSTGKTAGGAAIVVPDKMKAMKEESVYAPINENSDQVQDISSLEKEDIASTMNAYNAGTDRSYKSVLSKKSDGTYAKGTMYSYTAQNGDKRSFFVSNDAQDGTKGIQTESSQHASGGNTVRYSAEEKIGTGQHQFYNSMARVNGKVSDKYTGYTDASGKDIGGVYEYDGKNVLVGSQTMTEATDTIRDYMDEQFSTSNGVKFGINANDAERMMFGSKTVENIPVSGEGNKSAEIFHYDMSSPQTSDEFTHAAMATMMGLETSKGSGMYKIGNYVAHTGMTKKEAAGYLQSRGINGFDGVDKGNVITYHQHVPKQLTSSFVSAKSVGTNTIAKYDIGLGQKNAPKSWDSDGRGGGTLGFANKNEAVAYMQNIGALDMADKISSMSYGSKAEDGFREYSDSAEGFSIKFDGRGMGDKGMKMQMHSDGKHMLVSSMDSRVVDPFRTDHENDPILSDPLNDGSDIGPLTTQEVGIKHNADGVEGWDYIPE